MMPVEDACFAAACDEAADRLRAVAMRYPPHVAEAALVELLAQWICAHRSLCPDDERAYHQELLEFQLGQIREYVAFYTESGG